MNRLLRFLTVLTVCIGLAMLGWYVLLDSRVNAVQALSRPSYYAEQGYLRLYMAGSGCVILSLLSAFLAWNKRLDPVREFLPNAAGADAEERSGWVAGSTLDTNTSDPSVNTKDYASRGVSARKRKTRSTFVSPHSMSESPRKEITSSGKTAGSVTRLDSETNRNASALKREIDWEEDWDMLVARYNLGTLPRERAETTDTTKTEKHMLYDTRGAVRTSETETSTAIRKNERKPRE